MDAEKQIAVITAMTASLPTLRRRLHLTQAGLGAAVGVTGKTIYYIETGRQRMTWTMCLALFYLFSLDRRTQPVLIEAGIRPEEFAGLMKNPKWE